MPLAELYIYHPTDISPIVTWEVELVLRMVSSYHGKTLGNILYVLLLFYTHINLTRNRLPIK